MSKWQQGYYNGTGARENWLVAKSVCSPDQGDVDREVSVMMVSHDRPVIRGRVTQWFLSSEQPIRIRTTSKPGDNNGNWSANLLILTAIDDQLWVIGGNNHTFGQSQISNSSTSNNVILCLAESNNLARVTKVQVYFVTKTENCFSKLRMTVTVEEWQIY